MDEALGRTNNPHIGMRDLGQHAGRIELGRANQVAGLGRVGAHRRRGADAAAVRTIGIIRGRAGLDHGDEAVVAIIGQRRAGAGGQIAEGVPRIKSGDRLRCGLSRRKAPSEKARRKRITQVGVCGRTALTPWAG